MAVKGCSLLDKIKKEDIRYNLQIYNLADKMKGYKIASCNHLERMEDGKLLPVSMEEQPHGSKTKTNGHLAHNKKKMAPGTVLANPGNKHYDNEWGYQIKPKIWLGIHDQKRLNTTVLSTSSPILIYPGYSNTI